MSRTTLSTKGQVVLPSSIRTQLGLVPGSELEVTTDGEAVILRRASRFGVVTLDDAVGCVKYDGPARSVDEMAAGVAKMFRAQAKKP